MRKLEILRKALKPRLTDKTACLWFSGGKDSRLLLEMILQEGIKIPVLRFDDGWTLEQKKMLHTAVKNRHLPLYSYRPTAGMMMGDDDGNLAYAAMYPVSAAGLAIPIVRDIIPGERCAFDIQFDFSGRSTPPVRFALNVVGSKKRDVHFTFGETGHVPGESWYIGETEFYAPLYGWTDREVLQGLRELDVDYVPPSDEEDTGNIPACTKCLTATEPVLCPKVETMIDPYPGDLKGNLKRFREFMGVTV